MIANNVARKISRVCNPKYLAFKMVTQQILKLLSASFTR